MKVTKSRSLVTVIVVLLCLLSLLVLDVKAQSRTITVPDDFATIQEAINNANDGDIIYVENGVYLGNIMIDKEIILKGENRSQTILDANNSGMVLQITSKKVTITGFTIRNSGGLSQGAESSGINLWHSNYANVSNNIIIDNSKGIQIVDSHSITITNNLIKSSGWSGIDIDGWTRQNYNIITNNTIESNKVAIDLSSTNKTIVSGNVLSKNEQELYLVNVYDNNFYGNNITSNSIIITFNWVQNSSFYLNNFFGKLFYEDEGWLHPPWIENSSINKWDNSSVGNYWIDYSGLDSNVNGIGDSPHIINENNQDNYPLMTPISIIESTPAPSTSPTPLPPIRFYNPYLILFGSTLLLIALGILAYFKKYKGRS